MEIESLRLDVLSILYSIRNGEKYFGYKKLKDRLSHVDDSQLISELIALSHLRLIDIQRGLTRFLEGLDSIGVMAISTEGEAYFKKLFELKNVTQLVNTT